METLQTINNRRSIRKFTEWKPVEKSDIETILKSAMQAPSAYSQQPRSFVVIQNRESLDKLSQTLPYAKMLVQAPCAILVCGTKDKIRSENFRPQDCSAASQNILLSTVELNLWAVWCGVYPKDELIENTKKVLWLDDNLIPFSLIAIWHPEQKNFFIDRFQEDRIIWK